MLPWESIWPCPMAVATRARQRMTRMVLRQLVEKDGTQEDSRLSIDSVFNLAKTLTKNKYLNFQNK